MLKRFVLIILLFGAGCASPAFVQYEIEHRMLDADYAGAVDLVEDERAGAFEGKNRLLYHLERGMLLHVDGHHEASNVEFARAKEIAKRLEPTSVTGAGLSMVVNDRLLDYAGEDFEKTLIHLFSALNHQQLGDLEAALVEARQVADALRKLDLETDGKRVYRDDAFARYLSAMLFEAAGDDERAFVDYKKAIDSYRDYEVEYDVPAPATLFAHSEGLARRLGGWAVEDLESLRRSGAKALHEPAKPREASGAPTGEIILLHYNGLSPIKREERWTIPLSEAWFHAAALQATASAEERDEIERGFAMLSQLRGVDLIPIAFPRYVARPYSIDRMDPRVEGALRVTRPELVEDIGAIAIEDLEDRIARIEAKAIVRAALKWGIQKAFEARFERDRSERGDFLRTVAHLGGNFARYASERADDRVWSTLPDTIWMSSIEVPEGSHDVRVEFLDRRDRFVEEQTIHDVQVVAGRRTFLIVRTVQ